MKYLVHRIDDIMLSIPTSLLSVELLVFSFCFMELMIGNPVPIVKPPPVCPRMFGCMGNDTSTYQLSIPLESAPKFNISSVVDLRYSIR